MLTGKGMNGCRPNIRELSGLESGDQAEHNTRFLVWQFDIGLVFSGWFALKLPNFQFSLFAGCEPKPGKQVIIGGDAGNIIFMKPAQDAQYGIMGCIQCPICDRLFSGVNHEYEGSDNFTLVLGGAAKFRVQRFDDGKQGVQIEEGQFEKTVLMQFEQPVFLMRESKSISRFK
jgi:hypothetical protein